MDIRVITKLESMYADYHPITSEWIVLEDRAGEFEEEELILVKFHNNERPRLAVVGYEFSLNAKVAYWVS